MCSSSGANVVGESVDCSGFTHMIIWIKVTASAGSLAGVVTLAATVDGTDNATCPALLVAGNVTPLFTAPGTFTLGTDAIYTLAAVAAGTYNVALRVSNPPQYLVPRISGITGGGTVSFAVYAYGFNTGHS